MSDEKTIQTWREQQNVIASQVEAKDNNSWHCFFDDNGYHGNKPLFVAGTDISFSTERHDESVATITIVRMDNEGNKKLALSKSKRVTVKHPYISGFLGFREAPIVAEMLNLLEPNVRAKIDCLLLDGNGLLHPAKAGFACHVGVQQSIPTIGVSKTLLCVDGLEEGQVRNMITTHKEARRRGIDVLGKSGFCWARALITGNAINKPIYISVGHKVSLQSAVRLVNTLCTFRIPDPIRYADVHSRAFLRGEKVEIFRPELFD